MKQLEHLYTDINTLKLFMQENKLTGSVSIQVFTRDRSDAQMIMQGVQSMNKYATINAVISSSFEQSMLQFTKLPEGTEVLRPVSSSEFDFFNSGPVVIFRREPNEDCWAVTHVTKSVSQWGYEPEFFSGNAEAVKTVLHADDLQSIRETLNEKLEAGESRFNQQYRIYKKDGTVAWVSDYTQVIRNAKKEPVELIGYLVDITQDKEHEALYAGIINTTVEGFWLLDSDLKIIDVNYSLCVMLGFTKEEMIGKSPFEFIDSADQDLCQIQADCIDEVSSRVYEITFKTKQGGTLYTLVNATTMYDEYGNVKTFAFMTDISSQKKTEDELRSRQDDIEELNNSLESKITQEVLKNREKDQMMYQQSRLASMGEMIGNIAHQWRQPLNIMALVMQDLYISDQLGNLTSQKVEESYDKANNLLQYMSQTIDDFRNFFKQGDDEIEFSIKESVDSVYNLVSTNLSYNYIECKIDLKHDSLIKGGLNEFKQVLINIINNAQEAIQSSKSEKKDIRILITKEKEQAVVYISDDGGGIKKDVIDKIFDPYFTTKHQTQGTGLGLYMSKQIIENSMCGSLTVRNIDKGAEFRISLPVKK